MNITERQELVWLNRASQAIARVSTIRAAKDIVDKAAAIKLFAAKQGWSRREKSRIAEIEIRATYRLGELLREMEKAKGELLRGSRREPRGDTPTLADLGVTKKQSHVAQLVTEVSPGGVAASERIGSTRRFRIVDCEPS